MTSASLPHFNVLHAKVLPMHGTLSKRPLKYAVAPDVTDARAWRNLARGGDGDGGLASIAGSDVLDAYDYWAERDRSLALALYLHLGRQVATVARRMVRRKLPHFGLDVIEEAASDIKRAVTDRQYRHYASIRLNFSVRVRYCILDALDQHLPYWAHHVATLDDEKWLGGVRDKHATADFATTSSEDDEIDKLDERRHWERLRRAVSAIDDEQKRLVLMLNVFQDASGAAAAQAAGVKEGTARQWIRKFRRDNGVDD